ALFDGALGSEYEPLVPHFPQLSTEPCVEFLFAAADADAESDSTDEDAGVAARRAREADWIARRLKQLLAGGAARVRFTNPASSADELRPVQPRDIVILFRAMTDV